MRYKLKKLVGNVLDDFSSGQMLYSKVNWIVTIAILLGVYKIHLVLFIPILGGALIIIHISGKLYNKYLRDYIMTRQFKKVKFDKEAMNEIIKKVLNEIQNDKTE